MQPSTLARQSSAPAERPDLDRDTVLVSTTFCHPSGRCGERVESPHEACQAALAPYLAAERFVQRNATLLLCRCGAAWREVSA